MNRCSKPGSNGFVLISVVLMLVVLAGVAMIIVSAADSDGASDSMLRNSAKLGYLAEAGVQHGIWSLNQVSNCSGYRDLEDKTFGNGYYSVRVSPDSGSPVSLVSIATLETGESRVRTKRLVPVYDRSAIQTVTIQSAAQIEDTFLEGQSGHHDHNKATDKALRISGEPGKEDRALLQFDLTDIPLGVRIESAVLSLELDKNEFVDEVDVHRVTTAWTEAGATWETTDGTTSWNNLGGDYEASRVSSFMADGEGTKALDLAELVSGWVNGVFPNYGVILISPTQTGAKSNEFQSSDDTSSISPSLTVSYACECGVPCGDIYGGIVPVAHWRFDEQSGSVASDSAGSHNGELINGPFWTNNGKVDTALEFDWTNDQVVVPHDDELSFSDAFTISVWVRYESPDSFDSHRIISKETSGKNDNYWMAVSGGSVYVGVDNEVFTDGSVVTRGTWHHLAVTFDRSAREVNMYFDGVQTLSRSTNANLSPNNERVFIGGNWEGYKFWWGGIDDLRLFDFALTEEQIAEVGKAASVNAGDTISYFRDQFDLRSYSVSDGTKPWATDWLEINESDGPLSGDEQVRPDTFFEFALRVGDNDNGGEGVQRELDLSGCNRSIFSFDYRRHRFDNSSDFVTVAVSGNGGSDWTVLETFAGAGDDFDYLHTSHDISAFMSSDTRIRFLTSPSLGGNDRLYIDNVHITCQ